jgi:uracil-DNA glycosylase
MQPTDPETARRRAYAALLDWHMFCGVDLALDAAPHDRYAESARAPASAPLAAPAVAASRVDAPPRVEAPLRADAPPRVQRPAAAPVFPEEAARAAQEAAAAAQDLRDLSARFSAFEGCGFKSMARHFLLGAGTFGAPLMVIELSPGEEEERSGRPFDGARGRLLDAMLRAIGRSRETAYLAYFSPWRLPGDKTPTPQETAALLPFARRHIELAAPERLLVMGEPLARALLGAQGTAAKLYGGGYDYAIGERRAPAVAAPPLRGVLAAPTLKRAAWRALRTIPRG